MKGHHKKHHKAAGGGMESPASGDKDWEADERMKTPNRGASSKVSEEADERKRGGRAKRKQGGHVMKEVGAIKGGAPSKHAGRMPRNSGGRTGSNMNPLSSAHAGTPARGHTAGANKD